MEFKKYFVINVDEEKLCSAGKGCVRKYFQDLKEANDIETADFDNMFDDYQDYFFDNCVDLQSNFEDSDVVDGLFDEAIDYMKDIVFDYYTAIENEYIK